MSQRPELVGKTSAIERLRDDIRAAARTDAKVLITGESGVGKEIVATTIHAAGRRRSYPLVTVNCAAVSETLLESELFGHERGSFTGAYRDRPGLLESANGGTVFMDEIGETSLRMQSLLLRFLETGEIQRVGSDQVRSRVDVRVIAATNRVLVDNVAAKTFREDLYYRLNVIHLCVPPLRERRDDIPLLAAHFLEQLSRHYQVPLPTLAPRAMERLKQHHWPGNVRELKNTLERFIVRGPSAANLGEFPPELLGPAVAASASESATTAPPSTVDRLFEKIVSEGQSFWTVAYTPFVSHDLTREDLRGLIRKGLERTSGSYRVLVELFNMRPDDYKRFLAFLRKYQCQMPFQQFRSASTLRDGAGVRGADIAASA